MAVERHSCTRCLSGWSEQVCLHLHWRHVVFVRLHMFEEGKGTNTLHRKQFELPFPSSPVHRTRFWVLRSLCETPKKYHSSVSIHMPTLLHCSIFVGCMSHFHTFPWIVCHIWLAPVALRLSESWRRRHGRADLQDNQQLCSFRVPTCYGTDYGCSRSCPSAFCHFALPESYEGLTQSPAEQGEWNEELAEETRFWLKLLGCWEHCGNIYL